jgi:hypothetical protein
MVYQASSERLKPERSGWSCRYASENIEGTLESVHAVGVETSIRLSCSRSHRDKTHCPAPLDSAGDELGKLAGEGDLGRLRQVQEGQLVEHVGEPLTLFLPVDVDAPQRVVHRLAPIDTFVVSACSEVLRVPRDLEVLREVILPVHAEHRLALC